MEITFDEITHCKDCGAPVPTDVYSEELGLCLDCSDQYWGHYGNYSPEWGRLGKLGRG